MRKGDIRFDGRKVTLTHHSARGYVTRNAGDFTRGSQLITHEVLMTFAGVRVPVLTWFFTFVALTYVTFLLLMREHETQLMLMRLWAAFWLAMDFDPAKFVNLTLPDGSIQSLPMTRVAAQAEVLSAWRKAMRCLVGSAAMSGLLTAPLALWFVDLSRRRGRAILEERHERGAMLVDRNVLVTEIQKHNAAEIVRDCAARPKPISAKTALALSGAQRIERGLHLPYLLAGIAYPWRLEQSHTMLIGTTGAGKTTQLRSLVRQLRARGHRAVIFDLTGAFVEAFYRPEADIILNPMDERCPAWTIFNDCSNYADFVAAAAALIPSDGNAAEPFWAMAARTLFVEMCMKLRERGETSNAAIAHNLMTADLKRVHTLLQNTIADPLTATQAARMAESIRAVFNTNAQVLRFLPDSGTPFSIVEWMTGDFSPGSILFVTSNHTDLTLNRALLTLWMDIAVNALMRLPRTRDLRTWFLFDEVHALHRLPAIEHGLQTARGFGGAFVLGMHSFDKLAETYGDQGAINLVSLARTKLILATADIETAKRSADFIGNREVRQMDEAYSYGYNNTRDAATLTPRKAVEPLVIPDDITNLPAMHGFVKFPDGFPAARIKLEWRDDPAIAPGFIRRRDLVPATYRPRDDDAEDGEGGREAAPSGHGDQATVAPLSDAEREALAMVIEADVRPSPRDPGAVKSGERPSSDGGARPARGTGLRVVPASGKIGETRSAERGRALRVECGGERGEPVEDQLARETREGAGADQEFPDHDIGR